MKIVIVIDSAFEGGGKRKMEREAGRGVGLKSLRDIT